MTKIRKKLTDFAQRQPVRYVLLVTHGDFQWWAEPADGFDRSSYPLQCCNANVEVRNVSCFSEFEMLIASNQSTHQTYDCVAGACSWVQGDVQYPSPAAQSLLPTQDWVEVAGRITPHIRLCTCSQGSFAGELAEQCSRSSPVGQWVAWGQPPSQRRHI